MKKISIAVTILLVGAWSYAQTTYKGKITDANNNALIGADVVSTEQTNKGAMTNNEGYFEITLNAPSVTISHVGYIARTVTLSSYFNSIELQESRENLDEVVVSASREQQKRREVPGAISVVSAANIAESKAFGIEQLVNQVPGVFMSTSKVASNEQHFMAVRSPISTKSLFLYVEDGLPIRPTAVFNHNALLEMNNTSFRRVEVLKGPASSIYGSEAIGGSMNFLTKNPTKEFNASLGFQINDMGLTRYDFEASNQTNDHFGFYLGTHYVQRKNGPIEHSDYEKFALTFKTVYDINPSTTWVNAISLIDYRSDMAGSLSEADYSGGNYESDQTFSERDAVAFRFRSSINQRWNENNKTAFNLIFRDNRMNQNPSYRIRQFRNNGALTGQGSGEINSNQFNSYVALVQHKINFSFANSSLIIGATADYSPQDYIAENITVFVDPETGRNTRFTKNNNDYILNYEANIFNYAGYFQYEISPIEALKITAALRYDHFDYDYDNRIDGQAGAQDNKTNYNNFAPKLGINYNFTNHAGVYANYSNGFTPPQTSTLYRNSLVGVGGEVFTLKPSNYDNYEIGGYFISKSKWKLDTAIYLLEGKNTLVTLRDVSDEFFNANVGKTRSYGVEYGLSYSPTQEFSFSHNGSFAKHRYISFFESGIDYSNTDRETAPKLLGISKIIYKPDFFKNFSLTAEHELVGSYNTSFEGQIQNEDNNRSTATYNGHNIFNFKVSYHFKGFDIWAHILNVSDELYAARASYNRFRNENSYVIGNPQAFHLGLKYTFK